MIDFDSLTSVEDDINQQRLLNDLRFYWTAEEHQQYSAAPKEWLLNLYQGTDFEKYGPGIRRVQKLLTQFQDASSDGYKKAAEMLSEYTTTHGTNEWWNDFRDSSELFKVLRFNNYKPYSLEDAHGWQPHNLFLLYPTYLSSFILMVQAFHLIENPRLDSYLYRKQLRSDLYTKLSMNLHSLGFVN